MLNSLYKNPSKICWLGYILITACSIFRKLKTDTNSLEQYSELPLFHDTPSWILPSSLSLPSAPSTVRCPGSSLSTLMSRCQLLSLTLLRCLWGLDWNLPDSVRISFWVTCTGNINNRKIINKPVQCMCEITQQIQIHVNTKKMRYFYLDIKINYQDLKKKG